MVFDGRPLVKAFLPLARGSSKLRRLHNIQQCGGIRMGARLESAVGQFDPDEYEAGIVGSA